ncbi:MAG: sigma-54-dependent Fis family transcriptional regulator, partial [bacterium]|nr:sigma-54-dependent Fis family transcriptional regulator [bacterium]
MTKILLVEDQIHIRNIIKAQLQKHKFMVDEAPDLKTAAWKIEQGDYNVFILDLKLPDGESISLFDRFYDTLSSKTIIITANATIPSVVEAVKKGAFNYLEKPVDPELMLTQIRRIQEINSLKNDHQSLIEEVSSNFTFDSIVYESKQMGEVISRGRVLAKTDNTMLLQGRTGSGKEVLSHSIHNGSDRKDEIFLPINCASIPADLFESELFGFEKGAFTGAVGSYSGRFLQADKGTLFLDEIGELPLHIQAKLLRVLDDRQIYRLKSKTSIKIDVRVIAATNRDLINEVKLN